MMMERWGGLSWLALREFRRSFTWYAPGGRDFLVLSLLLAGVMTTAAVLVAAKDGLMEGFADSLIGGGPGLGLPIAVRTHPEFRCDFGDPEVMHTFAGDTLSVPAPNGVRNGSPRDPHRHCGVKTVETISHGPLRQLTFAPYWLLESSRGDPGFPVDKKIWNATLSQTSKEPVLLGWALPQADPLWEWVRTQYPSNPPAVRECRTPDRIVPRIVLNLSAFRGFDYAAYRQWLQETLPPPVFEGMDLPLGEQVAAADDGHTRWQALRTLLRSLRHFYLRIKLRDGLPEPVPFEAVWVDGLPVTEQIAYLMPLSFYHAMRVTRTETANGGYIRFFPEACGEPVKRLISLRITPMGDRATAEQARTKQSAMATCLRVNEEDLEHGLALPVPWSWYQACARQQGLESDPPRFSLDRGSVTAHPLRYQAALQLAGVPCDLLPSRQRHQGNDGFCVVTGQNELPMRLANLLAPSREVLFEAIPAVEALLTRHGAHIFYLDPNYRNALERFRFLSQLLGWALWPITLGLLLLSAYMVFLGLHSLLEHRRTQYGLMLTRGVSLRFIRALLAIQSTLAVAVGALIALPLYWLSLLVNQRFAASDAAELGRSLGVSGRQVLATPGWDDLALIILVVWGITMVSLWACLYLAGLHPRSDPINLMK